MSHTAKVRTVHIEGSYRLIVPSSTIAGAWNAELAFATKSVTPRSDAGCAGLGAYPRATCAAEHDIVLRDGDTLRLGARRCCG